MPGNGKGSVKPPLDIGGARNGRFHDAVRVPRGRANLLQWWGAGRRRRCRPEHRAVVTVQFRVLGPLEVRASDDRLVQLGAEKPRILLAALLLSANQSVDADRLVEALWSSHPPRSASNALRTYVSGLRGSLRLGVPGSTSRIIARG